MPRKRAQDSSSQVNGYSCAQLGPWRTLHTGPYTASQRGVDGETMLCLFSIHARVLLSPLSPCRAKCRVPICRRERKRTSLLYAVHRRRFPHQIASCRTRPLLLLVQRVLLGVGTHSPWPPHCDQS